MAHRDARPLASEVFQPGAQPNTASAGFLRRHFRGGMSPALEQVFLNPCVTITGLKDPIARRAMHFVFKLGQTISGERVCLGAERRSESLIGSLMPIHETANPLIVLLRWVEL